MRPKARDNPRQAGGIGPEHRSAGGGGPAIAVEPDDINVGGALRDPLFQDSRAFVDHGIEQPLQDLVVFDLARAIALSISERNNDRFYFGRWRRDALRV